MYEIKLVLLVARMVAMNWLDRMKPKPNQKLRKKIVLTKTAFELLIKHHFKGLILDAINLTPKGFAPASRYARFWALIVLDQKLYEIRLREPVHGDWQASIWEQGYPNFLYLPQVYDCASPQEALEKLAKSFRGGRKQWRIKTE